MDISLDKVIERLNIVPSFLNLDFASFPPGKVSRIMEQGNQSEDDDANNISSANKNLEAVVAFLHQDMDTSETCNTCVLTRYPKNIQALVMKCLLLHTQGEVDQFNEKLRELQDLSTDEYLITAAKSENAYVYSRMGGKFYGTAVSMYEEVIEKYPKEFAWIYRLGVIKRRCLSPAAPETFRDAKHVLQSVADNPDAEAELRALCYVELATLHCKGFQQNTMDREAAEVLAVDYLNKANELVVNNEKVLTETGKAYRMMRKYREAKGYLERAYALRPTSINCHQLGLVLQKLRHPLDEAIGYLEESRRLSSGTNGPALAGLWEAYQSNKQYDDMIEAFSSLTESDSYFYKRDGFDKKARCLKEKLQRPGIDYTERRQLRNEIEESNRKAIRYAVMDCLKRTPVAERKRISLDSLFNQSNDNFNYDVPLRKFTLDNLLSQREYGSFYSPMDEFRLLIKRIQMSLEYLRELKKHLTSSHQEISDLVERFYNDGKYDVCLDLVMLLMMTDVEDREKLAVTTILNVIEKEGDSGQRGSECFKHIIDGFISEEINGHVRLIYDTKTCLEEASRVKTVLERAGLVVKKNDEGVWQFTDRTRHLAQAMSTNAVIICLFKNDNTNLLDSFPVDGLANNRPVVLSMPINGSDISPILRNRETLNYPEQEGNGRWLKEFGEKMLNPLLEDLTTENHHA